MRKGAPSEPGNDGGSVSGRGDSFIPLARWECYSGMVLVRGGRSELVADFGSVLTAKTFARVLASSLRDGSS